MDSQSYPQFLTRGLLTRSLLSVAFGGMTIAFGWGTFPQLMKSPSGLSTTIPDPSIVERSAPQSLLTHVASELETSSHCQVPIASPIDVALEQSSQYQLMLTEILQLEKLILELLANPSPQARIFARLIILIATRKDGQVEVDLSIAAHRVQVLHS